MKAFVVFLAAVIGTAQASDAPQRSYATALQEAQAAFAAEDYPTAAARLDEAQSHRPYSLYLTRNRVLARYLAGDIPGAIEIAAKVAARGLALDLPATEEFARLRADPAFAPVAAQFDANRRAVGDGVVAQELAETGLLPEAIVKTNGKLYVGSVRTGGVFEVEDGRLKTIAALDGGVFDLASAANGGVMVAVANNQLAYEKTGERPATAAFIRVDLASGAVLARTEVEGGAALLGDVEGDGDVLYATDSLTPRIFALEADGGPAVLAADPRFVNLQGLALDRKRQRLYVADYLAGLFAVDLKTKVVTQIANPSDAHLGGVDGLYLYKGDLIGVQNGTTPQRIVRIDLDRKGLTARRLSVLQQALPAWNEPTHGLIDGDRFIYIATSNWPAYDDAGKLREGAVLQPLRLMAVELN